MGEYKKTTKEDIDFPNYCFFFIKEINESLEENDITNPGDELTLELLQNILIVMRLLS